MGQGGETVSGGNKGLLPPMRPHTALPSEYPLRELLLSFSTSKAAANGNSPDPYIFLAAKHFQIEESAVTEDLRQQIKQLYYREACQ